MALTVLTNVLKHWYRDFLWSGIIYLHGGQILLLTILSSFVKWPSLGQCDVLKWFETSCSIAAEILWDPRWWLESINPWEFQSGAVPSISKREIFANCILDQTVRYQVAKTEARFTSEGIFELCLPQIRAYRGITVLWQLMHLYSSGFRFLTESLL